MPGPRANRKQYTLGSPQSRRKGRREVAIAQGNFPSVGAFAPTPAANRADRRRVKTAYERLQEVRRQEETPPWRGGSPSFGREDMPSATERIAKAEDDLRKARRTLHENIHRKEIIGQTTKALRKEYPSVPKADVRAYLQKNPEFKQQIEKELDFAQTIRRRSAALAPAAGALPKKQVKHLLTGKNTMPKIRRFVNRQAEIGAIEHPNMPKGAEKILGDLIPDTPGEIALMVAGGGALKVAGKAALAAKGAEVSATARVPESVLLGAGKKVEPAALKGIKPPAPPRPPVVENPGVIRQVGKGAEVATKGAWNANKAVYEAARTASRSTPGRVVKAGALAGTTASGHFPTFVAGTAKGAWERPGKTLGTSLRGIASIPAALAGTTAAGLTSAARLASLPGNTEGQSVSDALTPLTRYGEEMLKEAKREVSVLTSKDVDAIAKATQEDYGVLPAIGVAGLAGPLANPLLRQGVARTRGIKVPRGEAAPPVFRRMEESPKRLSDMVAARTRNAATRESGLRVKPIVTAGKRALTGAKRTSARMVRTPGAKQLRELGYKHRIYGEKGWIKPIERGAVARHLGANEKKLEMTPLDLASVIVGEGAPRTGAKAAEWAQALLDSGRVPKDSLAERYYSLIADKPKIIDEPAFQKLIDETYRGLEEVRTSEALPSKVIYQQEAWRTGEPVPPTPGEAVPLAAREFVGPSRRSDLTPAQKTALTDYTGQFFGRIQRRLEGKSKTNENRPDRVAEDEGIMRELDSAIEQQKPLAEPMILYHRGRSPSDRASSSGYMSTTKKPGKGYGAGETYRIEVPAGSRVLDVEAHIGRRHGEQEVLLPRGSTFERIGDNTWRLKQTDHEIHYNPRSGAEWGRGIVTRDGTVVTWVESRGVHGDIAAKLGIPNKPGAQFESFRISPEGVVHGLFDSPDGAFSRAIQAADPRLRIKELGGETSMQATDSLSKHLETEGQKRIPSIEEAYGRGTKESYRKSEVYAERQELRKLENEVIPALKAGRNPEGRRIPRAKRAAALKEARMRRHELKERIAVKRETMGPVRLTKEEKAKALKNLPEKAGAMEKRAALELAQIEKKVARDEMQIPPLQREYIKNAEAIAQNRGQEMPTYFPHGQYEDLPTAQPGFQRAGETAQQERLSGEGSVMSKGEVEYTPQKLFTALTAPSWREAQKRYGAFMRDTITKAFDLGYGEQRKFTKRQLQTLERKGDLDPRKTYRVNTQFFDNPDRYSESDLSKLASLSPDERQKELNRLAERTQDVSRRGGGNSYYVVDAKMMDHWLAGQEQLRGWHKFVSKVGTIESRALLATSFSWMVAQVFAEGMMLLQTSPKSLVRTLDDLIRIRREQGQDAKDLAFLADATMGTEIRTSSPASYQEQAARSFDLANRIPIGESMRNMAKFEYSGRWDRYKGGFLREWYTLAEMDRQFNSRARNWARGVGETWTAIDEISHKLRGASTKEQLAFLRSPEGVKASQEFAISVDRAMGNWTAMAPWERTLSHIVIFYPFIRFSLDWAFRTFPKDHPVRYTIATSMGQWNAEQLEDFVTKSPSFFQDWLKAPIYGNAEGPPTGFVGFGRVAPGSNAIVEAIGSAKTWQQFVLSFLRPSGKIGLSAFAEYDSFGNPLGEGDSRIGNVLDQVTSLTAPTRAVKRSGVASGLPGMKPYTRGPGDAGDLEYTIRSNLFPFLPEDYGSVKKQQIESSLWKHYIGGENKSQTGGDRYSALYNKFKDLPDWAQGTGKAWDEYKSLAKQRKEGRGLKQRSAKRLLALYKQEGIDERPNVELNQPKVPDWAQGGTRAMKRLGAAVGKSTTSVLGWNVPTNVLPKSMVPKQGPPAKNGKAGAYGVSFDDPKVKKVDKRPKGVPSGVPPQYRADIAKWGDHLDGIAQQLYGMDGRTFLAKVIQAESNWDQNATNGSSGAHGLGQFIPSTRDSFVQSYGVDPWKNGHEAIKAAAFHLDGKHGHAPGLEGYNPGYGDWSYYLDQDVGSGSASGKAWKGKKGKYTVDADANRAGAPMTKDIRGLLAHVAGISKVKFNVGTGSNHSQYTTSGNVSDHWSGNAADIPVLSQAEGGTPQTERRGDRIAAAALHAAGMSMKEAMAKARAGGATTVESPSGYRVQVIWKSNVGGDHYNHVHIGVAPSSGSGSSYTPSSGGSYTGGSAVSGGGVSSGGSSRTGGGSASTPLQRLNALRSGGALGYAGIDGMLSSGNETSNPAFPSVAQEVADLPELPSILRRRRRVDA